MKIPRFTVLNSFGGEICIQGVQIWETKWSARQNNETVFKFLKNSELINKKWEILTAQKIVNKIVK